MEENEVKILRRYVSWVMSPGSGDSVWEGVDPETRFAMRSAYFLLDYEPGRDAESFVTFTLERLLQRVSRVNHQLQVECQGEVRGRVLWPATFKARYREDFDQTRYVCRQSRGEYDTPENQLLKFVVERMYSCLRVVPQIIRDGFSYFPASKENGPPASLRGIEERLGVMESSLNNFHRHSRLRAVSMPAYVTEAHLRSAKMSAIEDYGEAADVYLRYARCFLHEDWRRHMARIASRVLPLPAELTAEGESWLRLGAELTRERGI